MRWIKHLTRSAQDEKMAAIIHEFGADGYGMYWMLLEAVAATMDGTSDRCDLTYSESKWCEILHCSHRKLRIFLVSAEYLKLIAVTSPPHRKAIEGVSASDLRNISIPNLLKYRDEYSKRSGVSTDNGVTGKKKSVRRKDTEADTEADTEHTPTPFGEKPAEEKAVEPEPKTAVDVAIRVTAKELWSRHPQRRRDLSARLVEGKLVAILRRHLKNGSEAAKLELLAEINTNHKSKCASLDWTKDECGYAKSLGNWLAPSLDRYMMPAPLLVSMQMNPALILKNPARG